MSKLVLALSAIIVLGGGTSLAASQSIPGDMLYGYKLSVNEKIGDMLATSVEAKADRSIMLAERRLGEAAEASAKGNITGEAYASIVADFNVRMKNISNAIASMEQSGATEQAQKLAADTARALTQKSQVLLEAQANATARGDIGTGQSLDFILSNVTRSLTAAAVIATGQTTIE